MKTRKAATVPPPSLSWYQPTLAVKKALFDVENGIVLTDERRRKCIRFLSTVEIYSNEELASLFNVPVEVIFNDMQTIIHERNEIISSASPVDFISEYLENQKYAINKMRGEIEFGNFNSSDRIKALEKYSIALARYLESVQSLGILPKELGHLSVVEEKWVANISDGGYVTVEQQKELIGTTNEQNLERSKIQAGTILEAEEEKEEGTN